MGTDIYIYGRVSMQEQAAWRIGHVSWAAKCPNFSAPQADFMEHMNG